MKYNIFFCFNSSFRTFFPDRIRIFGRSRLRKKVWSGKNNRDQKPWFKPLIRTGHSRPFWASGTWPTKWLWTQCRNSKGTKNVARIYATSEQTIKKSCHIRRGLGRVAVQLQLLPMIATFYANELNFLIMIKVALTPWHDNWGLEKRRCARRPKRCSA